MSTVLQLIELREGSVADLALIEGMMQIAFDPRYGEAWTRNQCLGIMAMPAVWLTIASIDATPAGFALSRLTVDEAELLLLATIPQYRRCGVGAALLRSVASDAQDRGAVRLHLEVREGNDATKLYRAGLFVKVGARRNYYRGATGQTFDALTFSRKLT